MKISISLTSLSIITGIVLCILKACDVLTASWAIICIPFYIAGGIVLAKWLLTLLIFLADFC